MHHKCICFHLPCCLKLISVQKEIETVTYSATLKFSKHIKHAFLKAPLPSLPVGIPHLPCLPLICCCLLTFSPPAFLISSHTTSPLFLFSFPTAEKFRLLFIHPSSFRFCPRIFLHSNGALVPRAAVTNSTNWVT